MTFLIDGYNLMHAIGFLRQGLPAGGLERARTRFLNWLADETKGRSVSLRVVFDARESSRFSPEHDYRGITVAFAVGQTADDMIESILDVEARTVRFTVVSNDTRLQAAGRRRHADVNTCEEFVDWLIAVDNNATSPPPVADKPEPSATSEEMAAWLSAFTTPKRKPRG